MLYVIGSGLSDEKDITVKGLEAVKKSERVYLESYTSISMIPKERSEEFYGREVIVATRETVELESDDILRDAETKDISFLVVGDPLGATTHSDLLLRASDLGVPTTVIHNASISTALGSTGLQMYSFGQTLSSPFYTETWAPSSWYDRLEENLRVGMHTLISVDIKVREQSEENMARGRSIYEPPRFMSPYTAFQQFLRTEAERHPPVSEQESTDGTPPPETTPTLCHPDRTLALSLSRIGTPTQRIIAGTISESASSPEEEFGPPLHSVVIVGKRVHPSEVEFAGRWAVGGENGNWWKVAKEVYGVERESR